MNKIRAICFDLDGVYFTNRGKKSFSEKLKSKYWLSEEKVKYVMGEFPAMKKLVRGQISDSDFWEEFRKQTGVTASDDELANDWVKDYEVNTEVRKAVLLAKQLGYVTCVCTNNNNIRLSRLRSPFRLDDIFDVIVSSHEVGFCKPDKEIYEELIKRLRVLPSELAYADDNPDRLLGAKELGITTFVYEDFDQFLHELRKLGVDLSSVNEPSKIRMS